MGVDPGLNSSQNPTKGASGIMRTMHRRTFLAGAAAPLFGKKKLTPRERIDAVLRGETPDRPPFSLWHHFGLESQGPEAHAKATLDFQRRYGTDLVKVMSDFPYPQPEGGWLAARPVDSPFPAQLRALELIRDGLSGTKHFVETVFNPWNVAEKLSSKEEVAAAMKEKPQALLDVLENIAKSEANHAKKAVENGVSGVFLAIANAQDGILTPEEYKRFSEPFDRMVIDAVKGAPLNIIHLHGERVYVHHFLDNWKGVAINYSVHETGVGFDIARQRTDCVLIGGIDHRSYVNVSVEALRVAAEKAVHDAGPKVIITPGCSVPNDSKPEQLMQLKKAMEKL